MKKNNLVGFILLKDIKKLKKKPFYIQNLKLEI